MTAALWEVPTGWRWVTVGDVAEVVGGGTPRTSDPSNFASEGVPWITPADLSGYGGASIGRGRRDLSPKGFASCGATMLPAGSVLFSSRAPIGYCVVAERPVSTNQGFRSLVLRGGADPWYLRLYLLSAREYIEGLASGTTFKEISGGRLAALPVPLPPLAEQRRIVARADALLARSRRARAGLDRAAALSERCWDAALAHAFSSAGNDRRVPLGDLLSEGPQNGYSPKADEGATGSWSLRLTATTSRRMDLGPRAVKRLGETVPPGSRLWLRPGDLLVQRANALEHIGAAAIYDGPEDKYIYPDLMMRVRARGEGPTRYLWRYLNGPEARAYFRARATGTAGNMPKISASVLRALPVPMGTDRHVEGVNRALDATDARLTVARREIARCLALLSRQEGAILSAAFTGGLSVPSPASETVEAPTIAAAA